MSHPMKKTLLLVWPLMLSVGLIMLGNGLQGTLLGLRASLAEFPVYVTGIIMSLYYCGFVIGCWIVPRMVASVGHVRVFAAMASIASVTILVHGLFVNPWIWGAVRIVSGIGFAGLFIVCETWLNNIATNKLRGKIFSTYIFVIYAGLFGGQFLINIAPLSEMHLFVLISVFVSLSLLPVTLANKPTAETDESEKLPMKKLFKRSPLALTGVFGSGICSGSMLGIGAVYATEIGMDAQQVAVFIATYIAGCAIFPLIAGGISDSMDRRKFIIFLSFVGLVSALLVNMSEYLYVFVFIFGGMTTSLYSVSIAYMSDQVKQKYLLSAMTGMIFTNAIGACLGPLILGVGLQYIGSVFFFYALAGAYGFVFIVGIYRAIVGKPVVVEEQGEFVNMPARSSTIVMQIHEE